MKRIMALIKKMGLESHILPHKGNLIDVDEDGIWILFKDTVVTEYGYGSHTIHEDTIQATLDALKGCVFVQKEG